MHSSWGNRRDSRPPSLFGVYVSEAGVTHQRKRADLRCDATQPQHEMSAMVHLSPTRYALVLASCVSMTLYRRRVSFWYLLMPYSICSGAYPFGCPQSSLKPLNPLNQFTYE
jgi:hypothetical protein